MGDSKLSEAIAFGFVDASGLLGPGVYALCQNEVVVYVGQAYSLCTRLYTHQQLHRQMRQGKKPMRLNGNRPIRAVPFNRAWVFPCEKAQLDEIETMLIVKLNPKYNVLHKPVQGLKSLSELGITLESLGIKSRVLEMVERRD